MYNLKNREKSKFLVKSANFTEKSDTYSRKLAILKVYAKIVNLTGKSANVQKRVQTKKCSKCLCGH